MNRAKDWGVQIVTDHELIANQKAANNPIKEMIDRCDLVYLTIDLDVLPHFQAPGVSAPAPRGVPFSTIEYLIGYLLSTCDTAECQCPLADIVELSPPHDLQNVTAKGAALLARRLLFS